MTQVAHVLRGLSRSPSFTLISLVTLALGIGANSAIFSVVNGVLLRPLPYPDAERLVSIWQTAPGLNMTEINASPATYYTYREEGRAFEESGIWRRDSGTVTGNGEPENVRCLMVTDGVLPVVNVKPEMGRWFTKEDDSPGTQPTVILTYGYWQRRFGGGRDVIGRRLVVDGQGRDIIGVMPETFRFMDFRADMILPFQMKRGEVFVGNFSYQAIARLKPGVTIAQANADVARMIPMLPQKFKPAPGMSAKMLEDIHMGPDVRPLKRDVVGDVGKTLWVVMATVGLVLFIACANVANLLLVRGESRQRELAVRTALGAGWGRIARLLLLESVCLGIIGGILGLGVAYGAIRLLVAIGPAQLPRLSEINIDTSVMTFTFVISAVAGLLFGLLPVIKYAGPQITAALHGGGRTMSQGKERLRARNVLVVVQVALALILLVSSGLMIRTLAAMRNVDPGFVRPNEILTMRLSIADTDVKEPARVARMHHDIVDKIATIPGVSSAALSNSITMDGNDNNDPVYVEDHPVAENKLPPIRRYKHISPGMFHTMGNRLIAGRDITWTDVHEMRPVVLLSESLAVEFWGSPSAALGRRIRENPKGKWREVIGVAGPERDNGVHEKAPAIVYWPLMISEFWGEKVNVQSSMKVAIRSNRTGTPGLLKDVQQAVWSVNPNIPLADVRTVEEIYDRSMARTSFALVLLSIAAGLALVLGLIGIYGVISYSVSQRTREIGIRMALGAEEGSVRQMFLGQGLILAAIGVAAGLAAALPLSRLLQALLFGISPLDPVTYVAVAAVLLGAAALATYLPARRATAIAPVDALRVE